MLLGDVAGLTPALPDGLRALGFALRAETEEDIPFLRSLYASARERELAPLDGQWNAAQKEAFLDQQFAAQRLHYRTALDGASFAVIERHGRAVGRLYLQERQRLLHVVDLTL